MTNWDKFKDRITPKMMADLISTECMELGRCKYCPRGCKAFCKKCKAEQAKFCACEPCNEGMVFLGCEARINAWFQKEAT